MSARGAAGVLLGAVLACVAYAVLRLVDAGDEGGVILLTATVPYYWRAASAGVVGLVVGLLAGWGLSETEALRVLEARWWWWAVAASAAAVVAVP